MATLGERLKLLRGEKKLKAEDVAAAIGVKRRMIFGYEKNEAKPSYKALVCLAEFFCVSIDYLTGRTDNPKINE